MNYSHSVQSLILSFVHDLNWLFTFDHYSYMKMMVSECSLQALLHYLWLLWSYISINDLCLLIHIEVAVVLLTHANNSADDLMLILNYYFAWLHKHDPLVLDDLIKRHSMFNYLAVFLLQSTFLHDSARWPHVFRWVHAKVIFYFLNRVFFDILSRWRP